ncbi:hypothetical protein [Psychromarinibacter sp. S121]|uniref:hypothetical protein n=1 Tax=Psychromarinibacter sp. S121 TaxID=3415127 RepID=UPI003C7D97F9
MKTLILAALATASLAAAPAFADSTRVWTGPNGKSSTATSTHNCDPNDQTCNRTTTRVGPNGSTQTKNNTTTCENGVCTRSTGFDNSNRGRTVSVSR